ncbi:MAG TPA: polyprenol monophosphomannose synthase [Chloroflexia bacterium]|nr:polyprenol monophosphomannose synthase [Chloroflexia bacterium]
MTQSERVLVIIPTYNERSNLEPLAAAIFGIGPFHILVVDDNSPDGTGDLADDLTARYAARFFVLHRPHKEGLGKAYLDGFAWGLEHGYDLLFEMDADFSHDPRHLPQFVNRIREGADVVLGSRYIARGGTRNWSVLRRLISRGGSFYAQTVLGLPIHDLTSGFKCFRRTALAAIDLEKVHSNGYGFQIEVTYRCFKQGLRIVETPIIFVDRRVGQSKMSRHIVFEAMLMVWRLRLRQ